MVHDPPGGLSGDQCVALVAAAVSAVRLAVLAVVRDTTHTLKFVRSAAPSLSSTLEILDQLSFSDAACRGCRKTTLGSAWIEEPETDLERGL